MLEPIKVRIDDSCLFGLIAPVKDLKHISTDKLIISIEGDNYGIFTTMVDRGKVNVLKSGNSFGVLDISVALLVDCIETEEVTVDFTTAIGGSIIDYDHFVIGVILSEDGVEVVLDTEVGIVVVPRHYHTHRQLLL